MSDQHHNPYQPYDPYGQQQQDPYGSSYDYAPYPQQHQHQQHQQPVAWPEQDSSQHDSATQTWQTQTWDTTTWQQPLVPDSYASAPMPAHQEPVYEPVPQPAPAPVVVAAAAEPALAERPMTAAEKARAEGRPQIVSPGLQPALLTTVLAVLLAAAAPLGRPALAVPVVLLQAVTAAGWFRLNGMWPARQGIALAFLGGVAADIGLLATDAGQAPKVVLGTLGVWVLLVVVLQLRSHASPDERLYGLTAAAASAALAVLAAGHLAADHRAVVTGALGVAAAVLARALPLPSVASPVVALIAAAGAGVAGGSLTGLGASAALLGLAAGACALVGLRVASYDYPSRFVHMTAGVALPLALAAPVVYVLGRALA
ncbi:hypothetical protein [Streptomyces morookaense]|uniref:Uncharacterized protein n=1 Tax=Streptomyces morookaense TaxID=1970 RepID=A0A7Y7BB36_STRMO|nr:hypothetical protein [Streptomyces morookaense]NVK82303.1 hypothetical protein [Streptomyces morookaense]GHF18704.1 hypothetical protein GCM10010359_20490 [Streptomyces morookaense]